MIDFYSVLASLADENQNGDPQVLQALADWLLIWTKASVDVRKNGLIVPRLTKTGVAMVENPHLKIKERAEKAMNGKCFADIHRRATAQLVADAIEAEVIHGVDEQFDAQ